jgi:hypothetical protein
LREAPRTGRDFLPNRCDIAGRLAGPQLFRRPHSGLPARSFFDGCISGLPARSFFDDRISGLPARGSLEDVRRGTHLRQSARVRADRQP